MKGDLIRGQHAVVYQELPLPNGDRIVFADPDGNSWASIELANHNVFRLNANNEVVWQVRREESEYVNWESRNQHAKEKDPTSEGYMDPFINMSKQFFIRRPTGKTGPYDVKEEEVYFDEWAPGRLMWLATHWWGYDLDPETGIATCTGEQVK